MSGGDLPERYGDYRTVKRRYFNWVERGVLGDILVALSRDADLEWLSIDSTVIRAHSQATGARKQKGGLMPRAWVVQEAPDHQDPCRRRGAGQRRAPDRHARAVVAIGQTEALIEGFDGDYVLADHAYDADRFHDAILDAGAIPVIPPMPQRRHQHSYNRAIYKERNRIKRFFNKLKQFRRIATRYDKLLANFMGFVTLAAIHIAIR